jgi:lipopolysaccharide transport system permease protein
VATPFVAAVHHPWRHRTLVEVLTLREVRVRYRNSPLGPLWALLTPLLMLSVYTLVFGVVMPARWPGSAGDGIWLFALNLLVGVLLHGLLAEVLGRAPEQVVSQPNYVTKVVFPLEVLGWVALLSAAFQTATGLALLLLANGFWGTGFAISQLALPLILFPFALMLMGLGWLLSALGVYLRDLAQVVGPLVTMLMFLAPVFYPREALPEPMRVWLLLNPLTVVIEQSRLALFEAQWPDWGVLATYGLAAMSVYLIGFWTFSILKRGFADVL